MLIMKKLIDSKQCSVAVISNEAQTNSHIQKSKF